jgi:hypothetical protein
MCGLSCGSWRCRIASCMIKGESLSVPLFSSDDGLTRSRYTSLGSTNNTHPNPYLLRPRTNDDEEPTYFPAYMLADESKERAGRDDVQPVVPRTEGALHGKKGGEVRGEP